MNLRPCAILAATLAAAGCSHAPSPFLLPHGPGETGPRPAEAVVAAAAGPAAPDRPLPERIVLPADYRLILLDGNLVLLRDPGAAGTAIHVRTAASAAPAEETQTPERVAATPRSEDAAARLEDAFHALMERSAELERQTVALAAESGRIAELLAGHPAPKPADSAGGPP